MNFNEKLSSLRKAAGISQDTLAQQLGVSRQAISKWELGTAMPETKNIVQLAEIFDVTTDYLLGHTAITKPNFINQIKKHTSTISFLSYIALLIIFLFNMMIFTINCARGVTHSIKPLFWWTPAEYAQYSRHIVVGWSDFEYALVWLSAAAVTYVLMTLIRKKDEKK
ncbi:MAG: helix-turn-helix transcriptional regulator [Oscillospiraceae bacterium]|nr:helix-turn-helix transcriptional regulator [Oscillospiraceae bacterium]